MLQVQPSKVLLTLAVSEANSVELAAALAVVLPVVLAVAYRAQLEAGED